MFNDKELIKQIRDLRTGSPDFEFDTSTQQIIAAVRVHDKLADEAETGALAGLKLEKIDGLKICRHVALFQFWEGPVALSEAEGAIKLFNVLDGDLPPPEEKKPEVWAPAKPRGQQPLPYRHKLIGVKSVEEIRAQLGLPEETETPTAENTEGAEEETR